MKKLYIIIPFIVLLSLSCNKIEKKAPIKIDDSICAVWKRSSIEYNYKSKEQERFMKMYPPDLEKSYYYIFFPDSNVVNMWETEIFSLEWKYSDNKDSTSIDFITPIDSYFQYDISMKVINGDTSLLVISYNGLTTMYFQKESNLTSNFKEDPLHPDNNYWRDRSLEPIADEEIEDKVINYLLHYKYLFKASLDKNNKRKFTSVNSEGILKIYKSKIGLVNRNYIGEDWYSLFYYKEEALKAYDYLDGLIKESNIRHNVKPTENWVKDNYEILEHIINTSGK